MDKACIFILWSLCLERFAFFSIVATMIIYISQELKQSRATAASNVAIWLGTSNLTPLLGGFLADAYLGAFWTINAFSAVYLAGMILLSVSSFLSKSGHSCKEATPVLYAALYLVALGSGGPRPCLSSFGASRCSDDQLQEQKKARFFSWYYFYTNVGGIFASTVSVYVQENVSWAWGFTISTAALAISIAVFCCGAAWYKHQEPAGSPLTRVAQVVVAATRKRRRRLSSIAQLYELEGEESAIKGSRKLAHTRGFAFLDKAAMVDEVDGRCNNRWKLCTVTQVEELKTLLRLLPIWTTRIIFSTVFIQTNILFVAQGTAMDNKLFKTAFRIPPASLVAVDTIAAILTVPLYDKLVVPLLLKAARNSVLTNLQRMGLGLFLAMLSMAAASLVEMQRLQKLPVEQMSILWQIPQYSIMGVASVFGYSGSMDFFYEESPDAMRSVLSAVSLASNAIGSYASSLLVAIVTALTSRKGSKGWVDHHLDYFFWILAVLVAVDLALFNVCIRFYKHKKVVEPLS